MDNWYWSRRAREHWAGAIITAIFYTVIFTGIFYAFDQDSVAWYTLPTGYIGYMLGWWLSTVLWWRHNRVKTLS